MMSYPVSKKQESISPQNLQPERNKEQVPIASVSSDINKTQNLNLPDNQFDLGVTGRSPYQPTDFNYADPELLQNVDINVSAPAFMQKTDRSPESTVVPDRFAVPMTITSSSSSDFVATDKRIPTNYPITFSTSKVDGSKSVLYPLNIETNTSHTKKPGIRLIWQLYFAPTISYRKLSVNKSYRAPSPFSPGGYPFVLLRDVNSEVVHKPDMGLELGLLTKYPLAKNLKLTGGLQFNINRYDIKAFSYYGETATINLNGGNGNNSLTAWTYYRNYNGYKSDWLKNYYFSVSAPIGAELRLFGNDKTNFGIAGTVQPTYILKDRAFLISTDYKNYLEVPRLVRHVNLNTSLETYISYSSRNSKTRWQIGPQVRYQVLSSFQNQYPVKENLFDFGLKVGVTVNNHK